ncbi:MAG: SDR family oxidoreductase, partial [Deltaproteobacteria bacterium]
AAKLRSRPWADHAGLEIVEDDLGDEATLAEHLRGCRVAYYLVHSMMIAGRQYRSCDAELAARFARAAAAAGVERIVYLGGLGESGRPLSEHLASRREVEEVLREGPVPVTVLRAAMIIGSGSASFEILRYLVERLPVMVTPRWVRVVSQPIAIVDLLAYLEAALELTTGESRIYEIGGAERVSYGDLMREYARQRGLRRVMIPVPVLTPRLSSLWLGLVTPLYARVGRALVDSICHETVVRDERAHRDFAIKPIGVAEAISSALANEDRDFAETRWSDAISAGGRDAGLFASYGGVRRGRRLLDSRRCELELTPSEAFAPIRRIGGATGWYAYDWLWRVRGFLDLLVGGVGVRRGRPEPTQPRVGDTIDWWRVEAYEPDRRLRLRAEMKLPGRAWLEFEVEPTERGAAIQQTAVFDPTGLAGLLYWYGIYPLHALVFRGMLAGIAREATDAARQAGCGTSRRR